ncbi:MAG: ABC transporter permease [Lachnospiraceae bacterium]
MNPSPSFFSQFIIEQKKQRHKKSFLFVLLFMLAQTLWTFYAKKPTNHHDLTQGYLSCFYFFPVLNTILYPIFIAIITSHICDMEIKGETLKLLYTLQKKDNFYDCKYLSSLFPIFLTILSEAFLIIIVGKYYHFEDTLSTAMLLELLLSTLLVSCALLSIQQVLSLLSQNQILPLLFGLLGSFLGLFSLFFPIKFARLVLFGYFSAFFKIENDWDRETRIITYYNRGFNWKLFLIFLLFTIALYFFCRWLTLKKEI